MKHIVCLLCTLLCLFGSMSLCLADGDSEDFYDKEVSLPYLANESGGEEWSVMYVIGRPFVRLRQTDSIDKPYVDKMPYGSMVTVMATQINEVGEEWSLVIYNEQYGYCMTKYLSYEADMPANDAGWLRNRSDCHGTGAGSCVITNGLLAKQRHQPFRKSSGPEPHALGCRNDYQNPDNAGILW